MAGVIANVAFCIIMLAIALTVAALSGWLMGSLLAIWFDVPMIGLPK